MLSKKPILVLIAGAIIQLFLGVIYIWGVFQKPIVELFNWEAGAAALTSSIMLGFFVIGILIGGKLQDKIGSSIVVLIGGLMFAIGMFASSFIPLDVPWLIYITYGVVGGTGVGAAYNATIGAAQKSFPKKRGLATGIIVCSFGFSTVIFAPIADMLIKNFGIQNTFRIFSLTFVALILLLFRFIKQPSVAVGNATQAATIGQQFTSKEMIKTKNFYLVTLSLMLATPAFFILNPLLKTLGIERGLPETAALLGVMITGIASAIGRLVAPLVSDKIGSKLVTISLIVITCISAISLSFVNGYMFLAVIAFVAFAYGGFSGVYAIITSDLFGMKNMGSNYGFVMIGFATSALLMPTVSNVIRTYANPFVLSTILCAIGGILVAFIKMKNENVKLEEKSL